MKNILFITSIVPFPTYGGERIRTFGLISTLAKMGYHITAIVGKSENKDDIKKGHIDNVTFLEYDFPVSNNYVVRAFDYFRPDPNLAKIILDLVAKQPFELAFIDYAFLGQYISLLKQHKIPVIYGTHNSQAELVKQVDSNPLKGTINATLASWHEKFYFDKADAILSVSSIDVQYHSKFTDSKKNFLIANFVSKELYQYSSSKENYIIFSANFTSVQNINGLIWFLNNVWDDEIAAKTKLVIAGIKSKEAFQNTAITNKQLNNIEVLGTVADLKVLIANAVMSVVPLVEGSGTRLKCVEAMALKTQIVSTSIGAEGIEHEGTIVIADTPELFKTRIIEVLNGSINHVEKAYEIFSEKYSAESNLLKLNSIIKSIVK